MPRALISTTFGLPDARGPLAPADALGGGVSDGAGAYVQPALVSVQPARIAADIRATVRKRAERMGVGTFRERGWPRQVQRKESTAPTRLLSRGFVRGGAVWRGWVLVPESHP